MMPPVLLAVSAARVPEPVLEKSKVPPVPRVTVPRFRMFPAATEMEDDLLLMLVVVKVWVALSLRV